jgi:hypothetical protein
MTDTMQQVVNDGVAAFYPVEQSCRDLYSAINALVPLVSRGQALGMAGALVADTMRADILCASGHVANALAGVMRLHSQATAIAQANNVDVPAPNSGGLR